MKFGVSGSGRYFVAFELFQLQVVFECSYIEQCCRSTPIQVLSCPYLREDIVLNRLLVDLILIMIQIRTRQHLFILHLGYRVLDSDQFGLLKLDLKIVLRSVEQLCLSFPFLHVHALILASSQLDVSSVEVTLFGGY